jgi:hypothetical protein
MLLLVVTIVPCIVASVLYILLEDDGGFYSNIKDICSITAVISTILALIILFCAGVYNIDRGYDKSQLNVKYTVLSGAYYEDVYADDLENKMILYQEVITYNEEVSLILKRSESNWTNIFYPPKFWGDLKLIDVTNVKDKSD